MGCVSHSNRETFSSCNKCGRPVCRECGDFTYSYYGQVLCLDCFRQQLADYIEELRKMKNKNLLTLIFMTIFFIAASVILLVSNGDNELVLAGVILLFMCGITIGVSCARIYISSQIRKAHTFGPTYKITVNPDGKSATASSFSWGSVIFAFVLGCFFGGFFAPIFIIINLVKFLRVLKDYKYHMNVFNESYNI